MAPFTSSDSICLLLLPTPPSPLSLPALKAAYGPALVSVLRTVAGSSNNTSKVSVLDIALPISVSFSSQKDCSRSSTYDQIQTLVARIYKLISIICAQESIDVEGPGGVNARVILLDHVPGHDITEGDDNSSVKSPPPGPIINLPTLVRCNRPWKNVFSPECEEGETLLKSFKSLRARYLPRAKVLETIRVPGGLAMNEPGKAFSQPVRRSDRKHYSVAVGGTFDHLHAGHKLLLTMTAFMLEPPLPDSQATDSHLTIGITGDELLRNKKFAEHMQSWDDRQKAVLEFLLGILDFSPPTHQNVITKRVSAPGPNGNAVIATLGSDLIIRCVEISDPFGPTITDESISALVISGETRSGGKAVNEKRCEKGWAALEVLEVDVLDAEEDGEAESAAVKQDFASKISSTEFRRREHEKSRSGV